MRPLSVKTPQNADRAGKMTCVSVKMPENADTRPEKRPLSAKTPQNADKPRPEPSPVCKYARNCVPRVSKGVAR